MRVQVNAKKSRITITSAKPSIGIGSTYTKQYLTGDYNLLENKPSIEGVELIDDKSFENLGLRKLTNKEIDDLLNLQV